MLRCIFLLFILLVLPPCIADDPVLERSLELLIKSPKRGALFDRVYGHYVDLGQSAILYQNCEQATQDNPRDANAWLLFGLVAERRNQLEQAIKAFQTAGELEPNNHLPLLYLGELLLNQRRIHDAVAALEQAHERLKTGNRNDRRVVLQALALAFTRLGNPQKSFEVWNQLADLFPNDPDVLVQVAESMEFDGKLDEALKHYRRLLTMNDDPAERVNFSLAAIDIMLRQGNDELALKDLNSLLALLDSESYLADAVRNRIDRIFSRDRNPQRQIEFYQQRIMQEPNDTASLIRLVKTLQKTDRNVEAEKLLINTINVSPSNTLLRLMLIDLLTQRNDIAGAIAQFQAMDNIVPVQTDHLIRWGTLVLQHPSMQEAERRTEAAKIWTRIAEKSPNDPITLVQLADLFLRNKFYSEAERYYKEAMALRPNDFSYREHLATFYHQQHRKDKVLETLLPVERNQTEVGQLFLTWGYLDEAAAILREATQKTPQDWTVQCRYLEVLLRQDTQGNEQALRELFANVKKHIASDEQFALFLQQEVQLLRSLQKLNDVLNIVADKEPTSVLPFQESVRSHWHLATLYQAVGNFPSAIVEIEKVLTMASTPPLPLLRFAAVLYQQIGNTDKAIALYQQLAQEDTARSGDHWKQIITLQIQRGELPQALESSQKLLGHGTENADRLRFVADLFLSVGRPAEAVKLLRQALTHEPGNVDVLRILAQTLSETEQHGEAIELFWRLYDRHEHLPSKLSVIEILANEHNKLGRNDELIERLQLLARNYDRRREAMQALVRVFVIQGDLEEARIVLENMLDLPEESRIDSEFASHWVLRELVNIAENQNDFETAVHYQEMLCKKSSDAKEQNHLFYLYDKIGDTASAKKLFFDQVLQQSNLQNRLDLIDAMIRRKQYEIVHQVLDFLEIHEPEHWQIMFRRILVEASQNKPVENLVRDFRSRQETEDYVTSQPQHAGLQSTFAPEELNASLARQKQFLQQPPAYLSSIQTFKEARFLSLGLLLLEAMNRDFAAQSDDPTEMRQFRQTVAKLREMLPADSAEYDLLMERIRLEVCLLDFLAFDDQCRTVPLGMLKLGIDENDCQRTIWQIVRKVALDGVAEWQHALLYVRTAEYIDAGCTDEQLADYVQQILAELNMQATDFSPPPAPQAALQNVTLSRFRSELQGDRPIDRTAIYSLLPDYYGLTNEGKRKKLLPNDELLLRIHSFYREYHRVLKQSGAESVPKSSPVRSELNPAEQSEQNPDAELWQLVQRLESDNEIQEQNKQLALALIYARLQRYDDVATTLDSMELNTSSDLLMREWILAHLAVKHGKPNSMLKQRGGEAADRLLNFRLAARDSMNLVPILRHYQREEEAQQILNHLSATVSDQRLLAELFYMMYLAGDTQKENAARIARRILLNPAFLRNSRRLTSDSRLFQETFKTLQQQNQHESIASILETRLRGLRSPTDSRILMAQLYIMLNRHEEAKALALELAQNPTSEPERRQMIVSLLLHFGLQKELEAMNRTLLELNDEL